MRRLLFICAATLLAACGDSPTENTQGRSEAELAFARLNAGTQLQVTQASFWAVKGQARTLTMRYASGSPALEFEVGANTLLSRPDGSMIANGDSVQITVQADGAGRFVFQFEPSGLTFSPTQPALLRVHYAGYNADVNGDGLVNFLDTALELGFGIWRRDTPTSLWLPVPSVRIGTQQVIEGRVTHFTGFALAS